MRSILLVVGVAAATLGIATTAADQVSDLPSTGGADAVEYRPPLRRPVLDPFRAPAHRYGPGNRGLEYATQPGDRVTAIGAGVVTFAGSVAGTRIVTVAHPDGLRSSSVGLLEVSVRVGAAVRAGDLLGFATSRFHLGVRRGEIYVDPASLFARGRPVLVAEPPE